MEQKKRAYHHSEAWLAKHAEKQSVKIEVKAVSPKVKKSHAKKTTADKSKKSKKPFDSKKALKNAMKVFAKAKKVTKAIKDCNKLVGALYNEALKSEDLKYIEKIIKMFDRLGFEYKLGDPKIFMAYGIDVKVPKSFVKSESNVPAPSDDLNVDKLKTPEPTAKPILETDEDAVSPEDFFNSDDGDPVEDEDNEDETSEKREDEDDDEYLARIEEERQIARNIAEADEDARAEIFAAQEENGDFS